MKVDWQSVFGKEEWEFIKRLAGSMHDPDEKKAFWETLRTKKEADPSYSIFTDFGRVDTVAEEKKTLTEKQAMAVRYCTAILETLRRGNPQ